MPMTKRTKEEALVIVHQLLSDEWTNWGVLAERALKWRMSTTTLGYHLKQGIKLGLIENQVQKGFPTRSRYRLNPRGQVVKQIQLAQKTMNIDKEIRKLIERPRKEISDKEIRKLLYYVTSLLPMILWMSKFVAEDSHESLNIMLRLHFIPTLHALVESVGSGNSESFFRGLQGEFLASI